MKQGLEDVSGLLELAVEADDEETFNEAVAELDALEEKLAQLEFRRMFSGEYDSADCYLDIQAGCPAVRVAQEAQVELLTASPPKRTGASSRRPWHESTTPPA